MAVKAKPPTRQVTNQWGLVRTHKRTVLQMTHLKRPFAFLLNFLNQLASPIALKPAGSSGRLPNRSRRSFRPPNRIARPPTDTHSRPGHSVRFRGSVICCASSPPPAAVWEVFAEARWPSRTAAATELFFRSSFPPWNFLWGELRNRA